MGRRDEEDDYPEIGQRRHGRTLVCHGDDRPDQFATWLEPLTTRFEELFSLAEEYRVDLDPGDGQGPVNDLMDFCSRLGIEFNSNPWEGWLISGNYHFGWLPGTARAAAARGKKILAALAERVQADVRTKVLDELAKIENFEEFVARTSEDPRELQKRVEGLQEALTSTERALKNAQAQIEQRERDDASRIDAACVRLAAALLTSAKARVVAGPLVLWDDGVVYAICSWGGVPMPAHSSPAVLLDAIEKMERKVVKVCDSTIIGGWLSGPHYRKGPPQISGWHDVWSRSERNTRGFSADPPEALDDVKRIHDILKAEAS